jgi:hypothetical protein
MMKAHNRLSIPTGIAAILSLLLLFGCTADQDATTTGMAGDPLPNWNDGSTKSRIIQFINDVTTEGGPSYVAPEDRIAVFDNDGTLWAEKPNYIQLDFIMHELNPSGSRISNS